MFELLTPGNSMVLLYLAESGAKVKKDEVIARIDGRAVQDHLDDVEAQVDQSALDIVKLKSQQAAEMEAARQAVRVAKAGVESTEQDMLALDVKSRIDQEVLKLSLEEAKATYADALRELPLVAEREHADLRILGDQPGRAGEPPQPPPGGHPALHDPLADGRRSWSSRRFSARARPRRCGRATSCGPGSLSREWSIFRACMWMPP